MKKSYLFLTLLFLAASCGKQRYTVEISLPGGYPAEQVSATAAAIEKRLGQDGAVKEFRLEKEGPLKITFTSGLEYGQIRQLLTMPGKLDFSEVYTLVDLRVFTDAFEDYFQAERYHPDPAIESLFGKLYPSWGGPHSNYPDNPVLAHIKGDGIKEVKASFGQPFWRQLIPRDGVPTLKKSREGEDLYELIILRAGNGARWSDHIVSAKLDSGDYGQPEVSITFDDTGAGLFEEITRNNIHRPLAVIIDGDVLSVPVVMSVVDGGRLGISGIDDPHNAAVLTAAINGGRLEVPVTVLSLSSDR